VTWRLVLGRGGYLEVAVKNILPFQHLLHFWDRVPFTLNRSIGWGGGPLGREPGFAARGTVIQKRVVMVEVFRPPFPAPVPVCM
jgi:hypothetical protein